MHGWINKGCPINKKNITNIRTALNESRRCRLSTCNNIVKDTRNLYCSIDCRQKDIDTNNIMWRAKSNDNEIKKWPDTDTLINKVNQQGYVKTAKELGVSDKAIAKRLDKFNIRNEIKDFRKNCKKK